MIKTIVTITLAVVLSACEGDNHYTTSGAESDAPESNCTTITDPLNGTVTQVGDNCDTVTIVK